jgi:hypothetical protein
MEVIGVFYDPIRQTLSFNGYCVTGLQDHLLERVYQYFYCLFLFQKMSPNPH